MTGSAGRYAELAAVVRSFKASLMQKDRINRLIEAGTLPEAVSLMTSGQLTSTDSGDLVSVESLLIERMVKLAGALAEYAPHDSRALIRLMARRYEMECLKQLLKSIINHVDSEVASRYVMPAGKFTTERCKELLDARNPSRALDVLEDEDLKRLVSSKLAEKDELAAIAAVDQYYFMKLWSASSLPDPLDSQSARSLIGHLIDQLNIVFALRARLMGLDSKSTSELLIPIRYGLGVSLNELAEATNLPNLMRVVDKTQYGKVFEGRAVTENNLDTVEQELNRNHAQRCLTAFAGSPFNVGLAIALLFLKGYELHDMVTVLNGKTNSIPNDRIVESLIL